MTSPRNPVPNPKEIFSRAIELRGREREEFLDQSVAGDAAFRAHIVSLLEAAERPDQFLRDPTVSLAGQSRAGETTGSRVGPYKLLQLIGEGGFGSVYMAEQQEPVVRRVAIKIIKLGMDTRQVVARFEAERQALAMMDHPHIAKVLDGGATDTGRPYFVMELVKGDPITAYCDQHELSVAERLELLIQVCEAVQHAHQKGIIHRDIKPSNILVNMQDGRPFARVIDFGIAKATAARLTEKTLFTEHRTLVGTPEYMSPEQAEGGPDVDTRTDVYSLGVMMYELLTGSTPFQPKDLRAAAYGEIQRIIREVEPEKPSTRLSRSTDTIHTVASRRRTEPRRLGKLVRGELDWIVMKSLEKNRARRYPTPGDLGAELRRFLDGDAVQASPPSGLYRARKLVGRHRALFAGAGAVALALAAGAVATSIFAVRESDARKLAQRAESRAVQRASELEKVAAFQSAQLAGLRPDHVGTTIQRELTAELRASLERSGVSETEVETRAAQLVALLSRANLTNVSMKVLDSELFDRSIAAVRNQFQKQPLVRAHLLQALADTMTQLGLLEKAVSPQEEALRLRTEALGADDEKTLQSTCGAAELLRRRGRVAEAEPLYIRAYDATHQMLGESNRVTLAATGNMGALRLAQGKLDDAEKYMREALELSTRLNGEEHADTAGAMGNLSFVLLQRGQMSQAVEMSRKAVDIRRKTSGTSSPDTLESVNNLGFMLLDAGKPADAETMFREAYEERRKVLGDEHPDTLISLSNIGSALRAQSKYVDAERFFRQTMDVRRRILGPEHNMTIASVNNLAVCLKDLGRFTEAMPMYQDVLEQNMRVFGPGHPSTLLAMGNLGALLDNMDRLEEAEPYMRGAYEGRLAKYGPDHADTLLSASNYAYTLQRRGKLAEAEPLFRDVLAKRRTTLGPTHPRTLTSIHLMGMFLREKGELAASESLLREALEARIKALGENHSSVADSRYWLARTLLDQKKFVDAERESLEAQRAVAAETESPVSRRNRLFDLLSDLYTKWEAAEPGKGYGAKADDWKKRRLP